MKDTLWHFPLINPKKKFELQHYLDHVKQEVDEFEFEPDDEKRVLEAIDVLHSAETFVRKFFPTRKAFEEARDKVIAKNEKRGYYIH